MYYHSGMRHIPNKLVAIATLCSWALIIVVSLINGFMYGSPPVDSILPPVAAALIGWFAFVVTIFSVIKLYMSSDAGNSNSYDAGRMI